MIKDNMGGLGSLHYLPHSNLESLAPVVGGLTTNVVTKPNTNWKSIPFVINSLKFKEPKKDSSDGGIYNPQLELFVLCDDFEDSDLALDMESGKLLLAVGDHESRLKLLGNEDGGLKGISEFSSGTKVEDRKGYHLKFTGSFTQKSVKLSEEAINDSQG